MKKKKYNLKSHQHNVLPLGKTTKRRNVSTFARAMESKQKLFCIKNFGG